MINPIDRSSLTAITKAQRVRLIRAHRIERAANVYRLDFAKKPEAPISVDVWAGAFVLLVLAGAALALFCLPGAR